MKTVLVALAAFVAFAAADSLRGSVRAQFEAYITLYEKAYTAGSEEFETRLGYFAANLARIEEGNRIERGDGNTRDVFGLTKFSDRSPEEMSRLRNYRRSSSVDHATATLSPEQRGVGSVPTEVDWRQKGVVSAVKNQGDCGSCWAFSATEATESFWALGGHSLPTLAPQQVVSCDKVDGGCNGGDLPTAFQYIEQAGGIVPEVDYPYTSGKFGITGQCKNYNKADLVAPVKGYKKGTTRQNETELMLNVATIGPMAICVDASNWDNYSGGIVIKHCGKILDHCVQLVGYGVDNGVKYWLVRNSWGTDWGEKGYIRVERDDNDLCGIAEEPYYPTF